MTRLLPDGSSLTMVADTSGITERRAAVRWEMLGAGAATVALTAVLATLAVGRALAPLNRMTSVAERITGGDRGSRIRPDRSETELGHAAEAFDRMLDALEHAETDAQAQAARRAEAQTRRFLSDAAHELRTPLAGIQAVAQRLTANLDAAGGDRARRHAALLAGETRRASRLIGDLLDIARIDAGVELRPQDTDLAGIVDAEVARAALLAPGLTVRRTGDASLPAFLDPTRIAQILSNLLDNARRHTPPGGQITVHVGVVEDRAEVTVRDTGPGISEADRQRVFDRLVRLDEARDRDTGGAGLGLSIARALARAHRGDLVCLPTDRGAAFRLTLPRASAPAPAEPD